jgi:hypothetical protein
MCREHRILWLGFAITLLTLAFLGSAYCHSRHPVTVTIGRVK